MTFPQQPQQPQYPQYPQGPAPQYPQSQFPQQLQQPNRNPFFEWLQRAKRDFSRIGASLCLMVIIWYAGVFLLKGVVRAVAGGVGAGGDMPNWMTFLISDVPLYLNKHGRLSGGTVVPTIASNFGLVKSLELAGLSAVTSGVGDRHVYAKMREGGYSLGGEQTGHTIFGDIERTGDGIMTSLRVMEVIRAERETLSQLTAPCKLLPQAQVAVRVADKDAALENMGVQNAIAEAEVALAGEGRVLVRKSGTESVIRVLAEAPDQASADAAMKRIAAALEAL